MYCLSGVEQRVKAVRTDHGYNQAWNGDVVKQTDKQQDWEEVNCSKSCMPRAGSAVIYNDPNYMATTDSIP